MMTGVPAGLTISVRGGQTRIARSLTTPSDLRSAAFWMAAAAAMPGSTVTRGDVGRNLTRTAPIGVLRKRGPNVDLRETANAAGESIGTIIVTGDRTGSIHIQPHEVPEPIDELPDIASLGAYSGEVRMEAGGFLETLDRLVA
jgi:3-phosphoshikimate 1-carboxyvinyltransferase